LVRHGWQHQNCNLTDKEQAGPQPRIHNGRQRGDLMLDICNSDLQMSAARPGAGLGVGGPSEARRRA
jgi:hypothetical protein